MILKARASKKRDCALWTKLILGVIPSLVFGVFTVVFTIQQNAFSQATRELEQQQDLQQRRQTVFDNCIDVISDLLVSPHFNRTDVRHLRPVQEKVLTTLRQIDTRQKRDIIYFLYTNELIQTSIPLEYRLDLGGADLNNVQFVRSSSIRCDFIDLSLRGVLASNIVFSGCNLQSADFGESTMDGSRFHECLIGLTRFVNANLTRSTFDRSSFFKANLAGASMVQSTIIPANATLNTVDFTNTNLFQSNITYEDLFGITPETGTNTNIILNTRFPNGSFLIDTSQLLRNAGAEEECNATSNITKHWPPSVDISDMKTHKYDESSSIYPPPVDGQCYFLAEKTGVIAQNVDVSRFSTLIDHGQATSIISAHFGCSVADPKDQAAVGVGYLDAGNMPIVVGPVVRTRNKPFEFQSQNGSIPIGTRTIRFYITAGIVIPENATIHQYCVFDDVKLFISNGS